MNIRANGVLTRLLIEFWDPAKVFFKFINYELTPMPEEITNFTELPFVGWKPILPVIMPGHGFLYAQILKSDRN